MRIRGQTGKTRGKAASGSHISGNVNAELFFEGVVGTQGVKRKMDLSFSHTNACK